MPPKEYRRRLPDSAYVTGYLLSERGAVIDFVVKLHLLFEGRSLEVIRFDCAHGGPHKDILRPDGSKHDVKKYNYLDNRQGLKLAIQDLKEHWIVTTQLFDHGWYTD